MRPKHFFPLAFSFLLVLPACVPSPTATPPRQTPFPTLPVMEGTLTPVYGATGSSQTPNPNGETPFPTLAPATAVPIPGDASSRADTFAPIVQLTVQDPDLPVSFAQNVPLNVLAADNNIVARLDVYDNNVLYASAPVLVPASVYSNQFVWQANTLGRHVLRAIAYDANGNASTPAQVELSIINNNRAPAIQITSPSGTSDAELGAPLLIQGVATDDVAVTRMDLIVDNELVTYVQPERAGGITPFAAAIPWTPTSTGSHNILLRAYDNQNQSDDSLRYTIHVFDNQPPVVNASGDHALLSLGDVLVVYALALSNNGIARVELYVDDRLADSRSSLAPSQQTSLQAALAAPDLANGTHTFFVRAYDMAGLTTDTPRVTIQVQQGAPRIEPETPVPQQTRTPLPPTPTPTPEIILPGPPTIQLQLTNAPVLLPNPARIQITASGSSELDNIELWARAPGETGAHLLLDEGVQGSTDKTLTYDWNPPRAGVVEMYAQVTDNVKQSRLSALLRFSVQSPAVPTPSPASFDFAQTWYADTPPARYQVTFSQIGRALRGSFLEIRTDGKTLSGQVVSGAVSDRSVLFGIDFPVAGSSPDPQLHHTLEFDCSFTSRPPVLTCNYSNEKAERSSAVFQPLEP